MKKIIFLLAFILFSDINAQQASFINASTYSSIYLMEFDKANNTYVCGSVRGRIKINGTDKDYTDDHAWMIGKLNSENNFSWLVECSQLPRDFAIINETVYVLMQEREKGDVTESYSLVQYSYDLNGNLLNKINITTITGTTYDVYTDGEYLGGKLVTYATFEEDGSVATVDNLQLSKKMYSQYYFKTFDLNGNLLWQYKMEGGIDGFTELRLQDMATDSDGNLYISCYYGAQADVGLTTFKTDVMYKAKLSLYYNKLFLVKLNGNGTPVKSAIMAENDITVEDMLVDRNGHIYFSGYHKGNDTYSKKQEDGRPYIGAKFFGKGFEYSDAESVNPPEEHGFIGKIDSSWNFVWCKNIKGSTNVRVSHMAKIKGGVAMAGTYSYTLQINNQNYECHSENQGYSEGFYTTIDPNGEWGSVYNITGPKSNIVQVFANEEKGAIVSGSSSEKYIIINGVQSDCSYYCYWGGCFLFKP